MLEEPEEKQGLTRMQKVEIAFIIMVALFFIILGGFAWVVIDVQHISNKNKTLVTKSDDLSRENQKRIADIQRSRIESCRENYEGIRRVFKPFFPPEPRNHLQVEMLDKFNGTINDLKTKCEKQVVVKGG